VKFILRAVRANYKNPRHRRRRRTHWS